MPTLTLNFTPPSVVPADGYIVKYRKVGDIPYTTVSPNPTVSPVVITVVDIDSYEGTIQSDCGTNFSSEASFLAVPEIILPFVETGNYEELRFSFIYDKLNKAYDGRIDLLDPSGDFYQNHFVDATAPIIATGVESYNNQEDYPSTGTVYLTQFLTTTVSNSDEENAGQTGASGMACTSRIFVKEIFTAYPTLVDLYFRITIDKTAGPAFTRQGKFIKALPTPVSNVLLPDFDSHLILTCRVEKIGTDSYNLYAEYTT